MPPSLDSLTSLRVVSSELGAPFRKGLRWPPERYTKTEERLAQGDTLRLVRKRGSERIWRTEAGEAIRRDTVERLLEFGNLEPLL